MGFHDKFHTVISSYLSKSFRITSKSWKNVSSVLHAWWCIPFQHRSSSCQRWNALLRSSRDTGANASESQKNLDEMYPENWYIYKPRIFNILKMASFFNQQTKCNSSLHIWLNYQIYNVVLSIIYMSLTLSLQIISYVVFKYLMLLYTLLCKKYKIVLNPNFDQYS